MVRLEKPQALGRTIRQDDAEELGIPTWTLIREAIQAGRKDEALDLLDYEVAVAKDIHDRLASFVEALITDLAGTSEEEIEKLLRRGQRSLKKEWLATTPGVEESLQRWVEMHRGHYGDIKVVEEPDRYVVTSDPCGTGGSVWRKRNVGTTKKAYPWSWSKAGVPYYCAHCCVAWEIVPIELSGYPIKIALPPEKPEDPCVHLFYKKPELIPEEYFTRIGKTKTIK